MGIDMQSNIYMHAALPPVLMGRSEQGAGFEFC